MARTEAVVRTISVNITGGGEILSADATYGYDLVGLVLTSATTQAIQIEGNGGVDNITFQMVAGVPITINLERGALIRGAVNNPIELVNVGVVSGIALYFRTK